VEFLGQNLSKIKPKMYSVPKIRDEGKIYLRDLQIFQTYTLLNIQKWCQLAQDRIGYFTSMILTFNKKNIIITTDQ
jgi:hypothetical protein